MSLTAANGTALVRSLIKETTAKFWTDAEITLYLSGGMQATWAKFSPWLFELKKDWEDLGIISGTQSYDYPTSCFKVSKILVKEDGDKLLYIHDDEIYKYADYTDGTPVGWCHKAGHIYLFPKPNSTDTDYLTVYFMPKYTDLTSFPDCLQMVCVVNAAILAKTKDEDVDQYLLDLRQYYETAATIELAMVNMGHVEVFPDFMEEDTLE